MIYYDKTEGRRGTRVPAALIKQAHPCQNLEEHTGADFLITADKRKLPPVLMARPPHRIALERVCKDGILIQAKRGNDLLSSIADLATIEARMLAWSGQVWLVPTRVSHRGDKVLVDNKQGYGNISWASVQGAFNAWRQRGGSCSGCEINTDAEFVDFMLGLEIQHIEYTMLPERNVAQSMHDGSEQAAKRIKGRTQSLNLVDRNWLNSQSAWPKGIGPTMLAAVAREVNARGFEPSLYNVIRFVLSGQAEQVKGWGKKSIESTRAWWGYRGGDVIFTKIDLNAHLQ